MSQSSGKEIVGWFTMNGRHVPIYSGENTSDAIKRSVAEFNADKRDFDIAKNKTQADQLNGKPQIDENSPLQSLNEDEKSKLKSKLSDLKLQRKAFYEKHFDSDSGELDDIKNLKKWNALNDDIADAQYDLQVAMPPVMLDESKWKSDISALSRQEAITVRKDMLKNKNLYKAMSIAEIGSSFGDYTHDTEVDTLYRKDKGIYDTFDATRKMLKTKYGDEMTLYRAGTSATKKPTLNMTSTKTNANQYAKIYGTKVTAKKVKIDDILAVNISRNGGYEEFIVIQK